MLKEWLRKRPETCIERQLGQREFEEKGEKRLTQLRQSTTAGIKVLVADET